jgi:hypothetical protein
MKQALPFYFLFLLPLFLSAQVAVKGVAILNGGLFGNSAEDANLLWYNPATQAYTSLDTIHTQSVQNLLIDGPYAFAAAQDSLVKYDLTTGERIAANVFGAPSTMSLAVYGEYLLVGNWYAPFGWVGPYPNHLRIFDRNTLAFVDSIPEIQQGAKSMVILGDTAYVAQNYTSSAFADSAGWLVKVDLTSLSYVDSVSVNANQEELGRLIVLDSMVYGLNSGSNTLSIYDPTTGTALTQAANADFQLGDTGSKLAMDETGLLYAKIDGKIATYDLVSQSVLNASVVDTLITDFALDTLSDRLYVSQTNFFGFVGGGIYGLDGQRLDTLLVGFSPEAVQVVYNASPLAEADYDTTNSDLNLQIPVLDNDSDPDLRAGLSLELITPPLGSASVLGDSISYTSAAGFVGTDSLQYRILDEWGDADSAWVFVTVERVVGVAEEMIPRNWTAFPNPANDRLRLNFAQVWTGELHLLDLAGRALMAVPLEQVRSWELSLENLPTGCYLLQARSEAGEISSQKIQKQ